MAVNQSEEFVEKLCYQTFLKFWSYANPLLRKGKELTDVLIVCDPYIIIFSVKDINIKETDDVEQDAERWLKRAIDASAKQIYGAERMLSMSDIVLLSDGKTEIKLPPKKERIVFRVAVALGRKETFPLKFGDLGKGYVHVFDQDSFDKALIELDTILDFVKYLQQKEKLIKNNTIILSAAEEDFLAYYLDGEGQFPENGLVVLDQGLWSSFEKSEKQKRWQEEIKISALWDKFINQMSDDFFGNRLDFPVSREELEEILRVMAKEDRISRKLLSELWFDIINKTKHSKVFTRAVRSEISGSFVYVFLARPIDTDRELRKKELLLRCLIARGRNMDSQKIIGIGTETVNGIGSSFDLVLLDLPEWNQSHQKAYELALEELGIDQPPIYRSIKNSF